MVLHAIDMSHSLNSQEIALAAAVSGGMTRAFCQPFDVIKIRFQLQMKKSKYTSIYQSIVKIVHEEGVTAFWKGHVPAQVLSVGYGILQFTTWEYFEKLGECYSHNVLISDSISFGAGATAGFVATVTTYPLDVLRTRLVAQSYDAKSYNGVFHAMKVMFKSEGMLAFYKGLFPTLFQIVPFTGTQFMCYKIFTTLYSNLFIKIPSSDLLEKSNITISSAMLCGSLAGLCAKVVVYPLDLAKRRMQVQGMPNWIFAKQQFKCSGLTNCLVLIVKYEGFKGLYKGLMVAGLKALAVSGLTFSTYESSCTLIKIVKATN